MYITNNKGVIQNQTLSGTGKIAGVRLPDYNDINVYTKKESGKSDSEYQKEIVAQAIKDQKAGKFQNESMGFNKLAKNYVSEVSPDRNKIISDGLSEVLKTNRESQKSLDWITLLFEGKIKYKKDSVAVEYAEFYDSNGEMVATYSNNGWTMFGTSAETVRQVEMCSIYNEAWRAAAKADQAGNATGGDGSSDPEHSLNRLV